VLDGLFAGAVADSALRAERVSTRELEAKIFALPPAVDAAAALARSDSMKVIAEIKRRSPSRGNLADIPDAAELARTYERAGASAISVLTESRGFGGSPDDLIAARASVGVPLLRKDFIANEYQLLEARAWGADLALLIATWLSPADFARLHKFASDIGLSVLAETHSSAEIEIALAAGASIIGINTRDLETFTTDIDLFGRLAQELPANVIRVAESSVRGVDDVIAYRLAGADCVLVGEALVTGDAEALLKQFTSVQA
jgi:indole-3-glycerol phosphate synthase